mmetsp:Transcript_135035/g.336935  ORF Transcript_135035/g.336935 Transcript_135035/m.336935 type:complete len:201 (-) Transcript_135035:563-1165(-)
MSPEDWPLSSADCRNSVAPCVNTTAKVVKRTAKTTKIQNNERKDFAIMITIVRNWPKKRTARRNLNTFAIFKTLANFPKNIHEEDGPTETEAWRTTNSNQEQVTRKESNTFQMPNLHDKKFLLSVATRSNNSMVKMPVQRTSATRKKDVGLPLTASWCTSATSKTPLMKMTSTMKVMKAGCSTRLTHQLSDLPLFRSLLA